MLVEVCPKPVPLLLARIDAAVRLEVPELKIKELEVRPGAGGPGDGGLEAEGSEDGGPGARASGLKAGGSFRGYLCALGWRRRLGWH